MLRKALTKPRIIVLLLILQFIPIVLFPPKTFTLASTEWWLPLVLAIMTLIAVVNLVFRRSTSTGPWYLLGFSQGFNVISRLMMFMPHLTYNLNGNQALDVPYLVMTVISMGLSVFMLWYIELPEVRLGLVRETA